MYSRPLGSKSSLSLDYPSRLHRQRPIETPSFRSRFEDQLLAMDKDDRDEERYYLYLPRNLSYCHLCADVVKQHVQTKVKHLSSKLNELGLNLPNNGLQQGNAAQHSFWFPEENTQTLDDKIKREGQFTSSNSSIESDDISYSTISPTDTDAQSEKSPLERPSILRKTNNPRSKSYPPIKKCSGKKVVRFADSLGLELESVRHLMVSNKPPIVPSKAFADLHHVVNSLELEADFQNPSSWCDFDFRLRRQKICLNSIRPTYTTVYGLITVANLTFHKTVFVRYTTNGWKTYNDINASYVSPIDDEEAQSDRDNFSFNIFTSANDFYGMRELKLFFAICFRTENGVEYWDNNDGANYSLSGFYKPITLSAQFKHTWVHFL